MGSSLFFCGTVVFFLQMFNNTLYFQDDENQKTYPSLAAPVVMWVFLALPYFWGFLAVGYFWRRDIFGAPGHPRQAWHVSAACLAPAQLKGGCLLPEGSACDEYLLNLLTLQPLDHTLPTMGGGDPSSMGISCPTSNFPISPRERPDRTQ